MQVRLEVLGVDVRLRGPEAVVAPIAFAYRRFGRPDDGGACTELEWSGGLRADGAAIASPPGYSPTALLYQQLLRQLFDRIGDHAVLHAAALVDPRDGGATLIAAPSAHGKSSLTLALLTRGHRLLGDDYAPLDPRTGMIHPYPRAIALGAHADEVVPDAFRAALREPSAPRLFDKALIDPGVVLGEEVLATKPAPVRRVLLLGGPGTLEASPEPWSYFALAVPRSESGAVEAALGAIPGVSAQPRPGDGPLARWRLRVEHQPESERRLSRLLEERPHWVADKTWEGRPSFDAEPCARPVTRREAAVLLAREMFNRHPKSRFAAGRGDVAMVFDIAAALRDAGCWRVAVGRFDSTLRLIEELGR